MLAKRATMKIQSNADLKLFLDKFSGQLANAGDHESVNLLNQASQNYITSSSEFLGEARNSLTKILSMKKSKLTEFVTTQVPHPPLRGTFPQEGKENRDFPSPLGRGQGEGPELLPEFKINDLRRGIQSIDTAFRKANGLPGR